MKKILLVFMVTIIAFLGIAGAASAAYPTSGSQTSTIGGRLDPYNRVGLSVGQNSSGQMWATVNSISGNDDFYAWVRLYKNVNGSWVHQESRAQVGPIGKNWRTSKTVYFSGLTSGYNYKVKVLYSDYYTGYGTYGLNELNIYKY